MTSISNEYLSATINQSGAELISLKNNDRKEMMWDANPMHWNKCSPVLFPIVGTLKNNYYVYKGATYNLPRHGFARDMPFELIEKEVDCVTFSLKHSDETLLKYPFEFELQIKYTLEGNKLNIGYRVVNHNTVSLPFSIGGHPAFALKNNIESYSLEFESDSETYYTLEDGLLTNKTKTIELQNKKLPLTYSLFENDGLVFKHIKSKSVTILEDESPVVKLHFSEFPSLGIWTKADAGFICIEPWQGYSDTADSRGDLYIKEGMVLLESGETYSSGFDIEVY